MADSPLIVPPRGRAIRGERSLLAALAILFLGFGVAGGAYGVAIAVVAAAALTLAGPLLAYLSGSIVLFGMGDFVSFDPVVGHLLLAPLLIGAIAVEQGRRAGLISLLAVLAYIGLFVGVGTAVEGLAATTAVLASLLVGLSYGLHRYELLTLGLIDE